MRTAAGLGPPPFAFGVTRGAPLVLAVRGQVGTAQRDPPLLLLRMSRRCPAAILADCAALLRQTTHRDHAVS
jgi:hypothetical protein